MLIFLNKRGIHAALLFGVFVLFLCGAILLIYWGLLGKSQVEYGFLATGGILLFLTLTSGIILTICRQKDRIGNADIDIIDDEKFESMVRYIFEKKGYKIVHHGDSPDYEDDIIMASKKEKIVLHVIRDTQKIDIKVVQELIISMWHFEAERGYLITNNYLEDEAENMAYSCNVEVWDRKQVIKETNQMKHHFKG